MKTLCRLFFLLLLFSSCSQDPLKKQNDNAFDYKNNPKPLTNLGYFDVTPLIVSSGLNEKAIIDGIIEALGKIGTIDTSQTYANPQHVESSLFSFWIGNIAEEDVNKNEPAKYFPVIWVSLQISEGVEILKNQSKMPCKIWRKDYYLEQMDSQDETTNKTIQIVKTLVDQFAQDYQSANPEGPKPVFFFKESS